jgi:hypothetical protein
MAPTHRAFPDRVRGSDAIYEPYRVETIRIDGVRPHATKLVQSAAMASVKPPKPSYRPHFPARVIAEGSRSACIHLNGRHGFSYIVPADLEASPLAYSTVCISAAT